MVEDVPTEVTFHLSGSNVTIRHFHDERGNPGATSGFADFNRTVGTTQCCQDQVAILSHRNPQKLWDTATFCVVFESIGVMTSVLREHGDLNDAGDLAEGLTMVPDIHSFWAVARDMDGVKVLELKSL